jgi:DNA repair protein RadC
MKTEAFTINERTGLYTATKPVTAESIVMKAKDILSARVLNTKVLSDYGSVRDYLAMELSGNESEVFGVVLLNTRGRIIACRKMFYGTTNGVAVYPKEVAKIALRHNASSLIVFHCHPSGNPEPSTSDLHMTARLKEALALLDIKLLDHFVIAGAEATSFAERGLL